MRKYSMLVGAMLLICCNFYGIVVSTAISPVTSAMLATSLIVIPILAYIELNKRRILVQNYRKESFLLFGILIAMQIYFTILALALLVYLSNIKTFKGSTNLSAFIVGYENLDIDQVDSFTLPYYFANFLLLLYYIRCYYVMFWKENIVFIFRYLKSRVNQLNHTLLANLPRVRFTKLLQDTICPLCLQNYKEDEKITKLHCQHPFHLDCIKIWVVRSNFCPLCRKKVVFY